MPTKAKKRTAYLGKSERRQSRELENLVASAGVAFAHAACMYPYINFTSLSKQSFPPFYFAKQNSLGTKSCSSLKTFSGLLVCYLYIIVACRGKGVNSKHC